MLDFIASPLMSICFSGETLPLSSVAWYKLQIVGFKHCMRFASIEYKFFPTLPFTKGSDNKFALAVDIHQVRSCVFLCDNLTVYKIFFCEWFGNIKHQIFQCSRKLNFRWLDVSPLPSLSCTWWRPEGATNETSWEKRGVQFFPRNNINKNNNSSSQDFRRKYKSV